MNTAAALRYVARARRRHYYVCPCGRRLLGVNMRWPAAPFSLQVIRLCDRPNCSAVDHVHVMGAGTLEVVTLGPFPADYPVCPEHTVKPLS